MQVISGTANSNLLFYPDFDSQVNLDLLSIKLFND